MMAAAPLNRKGRHTGAGGCTSAAERLAKQNPHRVSGHAHVRKWIAHPEIGDLFKRVGENMTLCKGMLLARPLSIAFNDAVGGGRQLALLTLAISDEA